MTMRALLRRMAVELHVRGSVELAQEVLAEASGYPEADKLKEGPAPEDGEVLKTSDSSEDLGFAPYDKKRERVKSE